ncbi:Dehydrin cor47 [Thalictrum thalictroides]|uniref:Dehydrin cor47 n=1 Tax=Thalictrum thalictroides TaxID=46969 RepID=A0A7J6V8C1_THATH|nr:Dehydrin cor47 [Thalictrum thalictroides]
MAAEQIQKPMTHETNVDGNDEINDRGILDFLEKKEEENKPNDELSVPEFAEIHVLKSEEKKEEEENKPSFTENLHRSNSSSSSSDEEGGGGKEKSKLGLKDKIKEKIGGEKEQEKNAEHDQVIGEGVTCPEEVEDKKGFVGKIKEKLPGTHKTDEHEELGCADIISPEEAENKKGFIGKIKDKLPGTNKIDEHPTEDKPGFMEKIKENLPGNHKNVDKEDGNYY